MTRAYPQNDYSVVKTWPRVRRLDAHALALVSDNAVPAKAEEDASDLMDKLGCFRSSSEAAYMQARPLFECALRLRTKLHGTDSLAVAASLSNLALLNWAQGKAADARSQCERALAIRENALGGNHPDVASNLVNLARILRDSAQPSSARMARRHCDRALKIYEASVGPDHPDVATCLSTNVRLLLAEKKYKAAEPLSIRALSIYENAFQPDHPAIAGALVNVADVWEGLGDGDKAIAYLQRALDIHKRVLGSHPTTASTIGRLADVCERHGLMAEAIVYREQGRAYSGENQYDRKM